MMRTEVLCIAVLFGACGGDWSAPTPPGEASADRVASRFFAIRPTDGTGENNNGYGIPAEVYDPPGDHFRVYYVTSSENAVDSTDEAPKNGIPDFVEQVGAAAEKTYQSTVIERGFRPPLDDSVYHNRDDYGGDGRFDIYLRWAGNGSDGYRVTESCTDGKDGGPRRCCAGYFVMNPSFKNSSYPSELDGIKVLTSHELFHALQDAYNADQWRTWSEATAVWNELQVFPESSGTWRDYLGFLPPLFRAPERPLDQSMGTGGAAAYAYATAVWAQFLYERFGEALIREIWEGSEQPPTGGPRRFLDVTDAVLRNKYQSSLAAAYQEFTRWNLLTEKRAVSGRGYRRAAEYPTVRFEAPLQAGQTTTFELTGLSARYLQFQPALTAPTAVRISVEDAASSPPSAACAVQSAQGTIGDFIELASSQIVTLKPNETLLVVLSGTISGAKAREVKVHFTMPDDSDAGGCSAVGSAHKPSHSGLFGWIFLLLAASRFAFRTYSKIFSRICQK